MGILRTDKISGLETPTAVTGSVVFDGDGDTLTISDPNGLLSLPGSFTVELFVNFSTVTECTFVCKTEDGSAYAWFLQYRTDTNSIRFFSGNSGVIGTAITFSWIPSTGTWYHLALTRDTSNNVRMFVDGLQIGSTGSNSDNLSSTGRITIGDNLDVTGTQEVNGYISNLRILKGTALYTSNFTPPTHELEVIGDTVLLCCNNPDSAAAASYAGIGTSKTITVNGNAAASTVSPGLTRDFTFGTQFEGVSKFDTQGYFVPPSGTTEQQFLNFGSGGGDRGLFTGGHSLTNAIDYITISSTGDSKDFGDLTYANFYGAACASSIRGLHAGGATPGIVNTINYVTIMSMGNAFDFGDLTRTSRDFNALASKTRGVFAGGINPGNQDVIDFVTIASTSNAVDFGDLSAPRSAMSASSSPTRGIFAGGTEPGGVNTIEFITIASLGDAQEFGDLIGGNDGKRWTVTATASQTRSVIGGGAQNPGGGTEAINILNFITIASTGNAQDFGDLTLSRFQLAGVSNSTRGAFAGGYIPSPTSANQDTIDYITIATTGNAQDFGNLAGVRRELGGCSNGHGGLG